MIDRQARRELASALKKLATGKITNDEYQDLVENLMGSKDYSVSKLASDTTIMFDNIWETVRYTGKNALDKKARRQIARWILFLYSDCEMRRAHWPRWIRGLSCLLTGLLYVFLVLLTCGIIWLVMLIGGSIYQFIREKLGCDYWPFKNRADYELALRQPIFGAKRI